MNNHPGKKKEIGEVSLNSTETKQIRIFGLVALIFFGSLCSLGIWLGKPVPTYLFGTLSALGIGFLLFPNQLRPVFKAWLKIAHFLGRVVTTLILALAYYFVITPSALIKRIFGGTPLPTKPDKNVATYWVTREVTAQSKEQFLKRF
jgi:hypothetical protein